MTGRFMSEYLHEQRRPSDDDERLVETVRVLKTLPGGRELLDWFQGQPSFHDAEMLNVNLNRRGASMSLSVPGPLNSASPLKDAIVTFAFKQSDMIDLSLEGFSHQNVMGDMWLRFAESSDADLSLVGVGLGQGDIEFEIEPCFGAFGKLRATVEKITITPVEDYQKADDPSSMIE